MLVISICIGLSVVFESLSYFKQIKKTCKCKRSNDVSAKSYKYKLVKYVFALVATYLSCNWVGFGLEAWAFGLCIVAYVIIKRNKVR